MNFKMMIKIGLLVAFTLVTGCAAKGTSFQEVTDIPKDRGLVYVYRSNSIIGSAIRYSVYADKDVVCKLIRGGYCLYYAKPGEVEFWGRTESKGSLTVDVKAGQKHYVKGSLTVGFAVGRPNLSLVEEQEAMKEIVKCKLLKSNTGEAADQKKDEAKQDEQRQ